MNSVCPEEGWGGVMWSYLGLSWSLSSVTCLPDFQNPAVGVQLAQHRFPSPCLIPENFLVPGMVPV